VKKAKRTFFQIRLKSVPGEPVIERNQTKTTTLQLSYLTQISKKQHLAIRDSKQRAVLQTQPWILQKNIQKLNKT